MDIEIRPIRIQMDTNIPGKQIIELKKSLLYNAALPNISTLDEYPYFTMDVEYPTMHLNTLSYEKRVEFFFNKSIMLKTLKTFKAAYFKEPKKDEFKLETIEDKNMVNKNMENQKHIKKMENNIETKKREIEEIESIFNKDSSAYKKKYTDLITVLNAITTDFDAIFQNRDTNKRADKTATDFSKIKFSNNRVFSAVFDDAIVYGERYIKLWENMKNNESDIMINDFITKFNKLKSVPKTGENIKKILTFFELEIENKQKDNISLVEKIFTEKNTILTKEKYQKIENINNEIKVLNDELTKDKSESIEMKEQTERIKKKETIALTEEEKKETQLKNSEANIMTMLKLLFPTKYPIIGNILSSFNQIIMNKNESNLSLNDFLPSGLKNKFVPGFAEYSYLKIDSKIYTITQVVWLNDIYNHKQYSTLIEQYKQLNKQKQNDASKLISDTQKLLEKFKENYGKNSKNYLDDTDIEYFNEILKKMKEQARPQGQMVFQSESQKNIDLLQQFIEAVDKFKRIITNSNSEKNDTEIMDTAKNMVDTYKKISQQFNQKYTNTINSMSKDVEKIRTNDYIIHNYIGAPGINLNYKDEESKYVDILKNNYSYYTSFVDNIRKFRSPEKISTNYVLQNTIDDFLDNTEEYKFGPNLGPFNFLMNPYNIHTNPFSSSPINATKEEKTKFAIEKNRYKQRMNTGVTILPSASENEPKYEIYIEMNVIAGELNNNNTKLVDCLYKGESLGDKLEYLLNKTLANPWDINSMRLFFDITQGDAKQEILNTEKKTDVSNQNQVKPPPEPAKNIPIKKQGGGMFNTRKLRSNLINKTYKMRL